MRRDHRIDREEAERRRAVDEDIVETEAVDRRLAERIMQKKAALLIRHQFDIRR